MNNSITCPNDVRAAFFTKARIDKRMMTYSEAYDWWKHYEGGAVQEVYKKFIEFWDVYKAEMWIYRQRAGFL